MDGLELEHHLDLNDEELQGLKNQTNMQDEEIRRLGGVEHQLDLKDDELQRLKKQTDMQDEEIQRLKCKTDMQDEEIQRLKSQLTEILQDVKLWPLLIDMEEKDKQHLQKRINLLEKGISKINRFINHRPPLPGAAAEGEPTSEDMYGEKNLVGASPSEVQGGGAPDDSRKSLTTSWFMGPTRELIVKQLRLTEAVTVPDSTSIYEACRLMASPRVDALLLIDFNGFLSGILTDSDLAKRVIAREINNLGETPISKFMTTNPIFVLADTLAVVALRKMVQGNFKQLPVVENGEVIALLHMRNCFFDAFAHTERRVEEGKATIADVEKNWGTSTSGSGRSTFIETIRELMFSSALSTVIPENPKIATVSLTATVSSVAKKMFEFQSSCVVVTVDHKPQGILTSKDIVMRVIAQNLPPHLTPVDKVMTCNPEFATMHAPIADALHLMHNAKILHLPVVDRDGEVVAVLDVIHIITHAAVTALRQVRSTSEVNNEIASTVMQKLWDTALTLNPSDDDEEKGRLEDLQLIICSILISGWCSSSEGSLELASEGTETEGANGQMDRLISGEPTSEDMYGEKNLVGASPSEVQGGGAPDDSRKSLTTSWFMGPTRELIVKQLRLTEAVTVPDSTSIYEACRLMASPRVDALLLIDFNGFLSGILTDSDIAKRVIAREINNLEETPISKFMTTNPIFVLADTLAVVALRKMVQGNFKQLPVVENGEVIALLHMRNCFFDAFAHTERRVEEGKATIADVEKNWGTSTSGSGRSTFIETIRELMFSSALSTVIPENPKIATVSLTATVSSVAKKMFEFQSSCVVVTVDHKPQGILTSKDIVMRVIAQNLPPHLTPVDKVMTCNPEFATMHAPIADALHLMHNAKFLHLPVVDRDGEVVAVLDVIHIITHAAVTALRQVRSTSEVNNEIASTVMQKLWDTALTLNPSDDDEEKGRLEDLQLIICSILISGWCSSSEGSLELASEGTETEGANGQTHRLISEQTTTRNKFGEEYLVGATQSTAFKEQTVIGNKLGEEHLVGARQSVVFNGEELTNSEMFQEQTVIRNKLGEEHLVGARQSIVVKGEELRNSEIFQGK